MSEKLKPCPFCGGKAKVWKNRCGEFLYIACPNCRIITWDDQEENEAFHRWNTRAYERNGGEKQ